MPGGDGTGPLGRGPMTGGARGICVGSGRPFGGRRRWPGLGRSGRGGHRWYHSLGLGRWLRDWDPASGDAPLPPESLDALKVHEQALRRTLEEMQQRIRGMEG
jgi:hypothetical protein